MLEFKKQGNTKTEIFFCEFKGLQRVDKLYITPRTLTSRNIISKSLREKKYSTIGLALAKSLATVKYQTARNYVTLVRLFTISSAESRENSSNSLWAATVIYFKNILEIISLNKGNRKCCDRALDKSCSKGTAMFSR